MEYLITLDLGTTSTKTTMFDKNLTSVASFTEEYQLLTPASAMVELEPQTYWAACVNGIRSVLEKSGVDPASVAVISISTQGETLIPVDTEGKALSNAIVWLDARANDEAEYIRERTSDDETFKITGLPPVASAYPLSKLLWVKNNKPEVYDKTYKFLLLGDYILNKLSGAFVSEPTNMSSTGYFNVRDNVLWAEILEKAGIDTDKIPEIVPSGTIVGNILPVVAAETGLSVSTKAIAGANDQIAGAVGTGNITPGSVSETTGTALAVVCTADKMPESNEFNVTVSRHSTGNFLVLAYSPTSGIVYKWFKDVFCENELALSEKEGLDIYAFLDRQAESIPRGADGLMLIPYFAGKLCPDYNEDIRGVFYGLELGHSKGHFVRAILEGIACMLRENMEIAYKLCGEADKIISTGGGAKSPLWSQIKADMLDKEIFIAQGEGSSLGAAIIGAVSAGWFDSIEKACEASVHISGAYMPDGESVPVYEKLYQKYLLLYNSLLPVFQSK